MYDILLENHPYAALYKTASEVFDELDENERENFRLLIIDTDKQGTERVLHDPNLRPVNVDLDDQAKLKQIHPGRLGIESEAGSKLVAQVYNSKYIM